MKLEGKQTILHAMDNACQTKPVNKLAVHQFFPKIIKLRYVQLFFSNNNLIPYSTDNASPK